MRSFKGFFVSLLTTVALLAVHQPAPVQAKTQKPRFQGTHVLTVVMVEGPGRNRSDLTKDVVRALIAEASDTWGRSTDGKINLRLKKIVSWQRTRRSCDTGVMIEMEKRLRFRPTDRTHLVILQPDKGVCENAGEGGFGVSIVFWPDNPDLLSKRVRNTGWVIAHELGHDMNLGHSIQSRCSSALQLLCPKNLEESGEFGEHSGSDFMGSGSSRLSASMLSHLKLVAVSDATVVDLSVPKLSTIVLNRSSERGMRYLKLVDGRNTWWLQYEVNSLPVAGTPSGSEKRSLRVSVPLRDGESYEQPVESAGKIRSAGLLEGGIYRLSRGILNVKALGDTATIEIDTRSVAAGVTTSASGGVLNISWESSLSVGQLTRIAVQAPYAKWNYETSDDFAAGYSLSVIRQILEAGASTASFSGLRSATPYRVVVEVSDGNDVWRVVAIGQPLLLE